MLNEYENCKHKGRVKSKRNVFKRKLEPLAEEGLCLALKNACSIEIFFSLLPGLVLGFLHHFNNINFLLI